MNDVETRPRPLRTLAFQLGLWHVVAFVASFALLAAFSIPIVRSALDHERAVIVERRLERHVALLTAGLPAYREAIERSSSLDDAKDAVRVRDDAGRTLYEHGDVTRARFVVARTVGDLRVELGAPAMQWDAVLDRLQPGWIVLACGALIVAVTGAWILTRRGLRPVRELAATARDVIRSGDLSRRVPERGARDELDTLSTLFNRMLDRNQRLVTGMREALDNVGHDLRTPLTRLRGTAEVALRSSDPEQTREALITSVEESDRILAMLRAILQVSEADAGIIRLEREPVSLGRLAEDIADLYAHVAEESAIDLRVLPSSEVIVDADLARLRQAIANLVDNAIKYTPRGGRVSLDVIRGERAARVRVSDTGEGIPPEAIPRIWDRLYRGDRSRSKHGLGLGLSLVKAIVEAHGGSVAAESEPGRGSVFTISLPFRAPSDSNGSDRAPLHPALLTS